MPVKPLPPKPSLDHLKYQAKDLLAGHAGRDRLAAQRMREFLPGFSSASDDDIFAAPFNLAAAQLTVAREYGSPSWPRLKERIQMPSASSNVNLPHHERIEYAAFRRAVDLLDAGDATGLRAYLARRPMLATQRVVFEGDNYFRNPALLEFIAENPVRHGTLPVNILGVAEVILNAGVDRSALNETLGLVCSGRVVRECRVQVPLIDLLCDRGADPDGPMHAALVHGEFEAVHALIRRGARMTLPVAAALGLSDEMRRSLAAAGSEDRHRGLALASQFGHTEAVRLLLDAGEDPNRYNPLGCHSHSTPLHQAALAGHEEVVRLLVERGARVDLLDVLWKGTPAGWAAHAGKAAIATHLRALEESKNEADA